MKFNKNIKYFFISMIISSIFLFTIVCFIIAERNISCIILGSDSPFCELLPNEKIIKINFIDKVIKIDYQEILLCILRKSKKYLLGVKNL